MMIYHGTFTVDLKLLDIPTLQFIGKAYMNKYVLKEFYEKQHDHALNQLYLQNAQNVFSEICTRCIPLVINSQKTIDWYDYISRLRDKVYPIILHQWLTPDHSDKGDPPMFFLNKFNQTMLELVYVFWVKEWVEEEEQIKEIEREKGESYGTNPNIT